MFEQNFFNQSVALVKYPDSNWYLHKNRFIKSDRDVNEYYVFKLTLINTLNTVLDPDLSVSIINLGLLYSYSFNKLLTKPKYQLDIKITLTSINCPSGSAILKKIKYLFLNLRCVVFIKIYTVWNPSWTSKLAFKYLN
jgi:metal-sulfur cluster biosynthetic enzyme